MAFWIKQWLKSRGENFGTVSQYVLRSSQPSFERLKEYKEKFGLATVLNLRDDVKQEEIDEVEAAGLEFFNIPMSDTKTPNWDDVNEAMYYLSRARVNKQPILVHCIGGRHRTSVIAAIYRVKYCQDSAEKAWKEQAENFGWYGALGHEPLKTWFFENFK